MNRIYRNDRVGNEESRQDRYGVLYLLARLLPLQVVWLTEKPRNLSLDHKILIVFVSSLFIGSFGKAMEVWGMLLLTDRAFI